MSLLLTKTFYSSHLPHTGFIKFHKRHVVKCPECSNIILILHTIRNNAFSYRSKDKDENKRIIYQCLSCNRYFSCCAKQYKEKKDKVYY